MESEFKVDSTKLYQLIYNKLSTTKLDLNQVKEISKHLTYAESIGVSSHGSIRLRYYIKRIKAGGTTSNPEIEISMTSPNTLIIDGKNASGFYVVNLGMEKALELAVDHGIVLVNMKNIGHSGTLSYYLRQATLKNCIAISFVQSDPGVVLPHSNEIFYGTNPFGYGIPTNEGPIIYDGATSQVSWGKILVARLNKQTIPLGWGVDVNGQDTSDPHLVKYLKPMADYKGFALMMLIDTIAGLLSGLKGGLNVSSMSDDLSLGRGLGQTHIIINPAFFGDEQAFKERVSKLLEQLTSLNDLDNQPIKYPGQSSLARFKENEQSGIKLHPKIYNYLVNEERE
ncbi:MAG: Ldh family oxidoreductase [Bacilli bacterium]